MKTDVKIIPYNQIKKINSCYTCGKISEGHSVSRSPPYTAFIISLLEAFYGYVLFAFRISRTLGDNRNRRNDTGKTAAAHACSSPEVA